MYVWEGQKGWGQLSSLGFSGRIYSQRLENLGIVICSAKEA